MGSLKELHDHHAESIANVLSLTLSSSLFSVCAVTQRRHKMQTRFITKVTARFNPFSVCAKPARLFLTYLPPNARASGTSVETILLPRNTTEPSSLKVDFSTQAYLPLFIICRCGG